MKHCKKLLAVLLSCLMLVSSCSTVIFAADASGATVVGAAIADTLLNTVSVTVDRLLRVSFNAVLGLVRLSWRGIGNVNNYQNALAEKYSGSADFIDEAAEGAGFSLGYDKRSILPDDLLTRNYYKYGASGNVFDVRVEQTPAQLAEMYAAEYAADNGLSDAERAEVEAFLKERYSVDELSVRTTALSDGRGTTLFATIDCIGMTNASKYEIVKRIDDYCAQKGITDIQSINFSATHTHSGIDTLGILEFTGKIGNETGTALLKTFKSLLTGKTFGSPDSIFMDHLYDTVAASMIAAYEGMEKGDLYFSAKESYLEYTDAATGETKSANFFNYNDDALEVHSVIDKFTFVPANDPTKITVITNFPVHPERVGVSGDLQTAISADFIPYMEQAMQRDYAAKGFTCNVQFINSAIGSFIKENDGAIKEVYRARYNVEPESLTDNNYEGRSLQYGFMMGDFIADMPLGEKLDPILNVRNEQMIVKCDNPVIRLLAICRVTNNEILTDFWNNVYCVSEVGYMELGKNVKIFLCPGEINPELVWTDGHLLSGEYSVTKEDFPYNCVASYFGEDDHVLTFGLVNDMSGYIDPDNDYALPVLRYSNYGSADGKYTVQMNANNLLFSLSSDYASNLVGTFLNVVNAANGQPVQPVVSYNHGNVIPHYWSFFTAVFNVMLGVMNIKLG